MRVDEDDMPLEVALVAGTVGAIGAWEARLLAALQLHVLRQAALPAVHAAALRALEATRTVADRLASRPPRPNPRVHPVALRRAIVLAGLVRTMGPCSVQITVILGGACGTGT